MTQYELRIKLLLEKCLTPQFQIKNDVFLNTLISHLDGKYNAELGKEIILLPCITEWIPTAVTTWAQTTKPSLTISSFFLNLTALCSQHETTFVQLLSCDTYDKIFTSFEVRLQKVQPTLKMAYIKILTSFLAHKAGLEWIMSNDAWKDVLNLCLAKETVYIMREGRAFIYNLLLKSVDVNETFAEFVVSEILLVFDNQYLDVYNLFADMREQALENQLGCTIKLIIHIFDHFVESDCYKNRDYRVANIFLKYKLEELVDKVVILARNNDFLFELCSVLYHIYCFELVVNTKGESFDGDSLTRTAQRLFSKIGTSIANEVNARTILKLCYCADYHWQQLGVGERRPEIQHLINGKIPMRFQNQLVSMQIMPVLCLSMKHYNLTSAEICDDDMRDSFINNIFKIMCENTIRVAYSWKTLLLKQENMFDICTFSLLYAVKWKKLYDKSRAILMFQGFMYNLQDTQFAIKKDPVALEICSKQISFYITLLETITEFIKEFEITWRDSLETISVTNCAIEFLSHPIWPSRLIVAALKLVKLSVAKFMSPNLALLVDEQNECFMYSLGSMLCAKLASMHWEVRDSALEVMHTVANIANTKYPAFQTMLMELDLISLIITMCVSDSVSFVRASAFKCLQKMIQVRQFWTKVLAEQELPQKIMHALRHETEAMVRTEAATLMRYINEYQSFPEDLMDEIYNTMAYAATSDLHWEVKMSALSFWENVILNHLVEQGYIDGKFPSVTFSKENRKIVTLTEPEVQMRLNKVLLQLSKNGCLGVLFNAVQDDCDLEVAKKALAVTKTLAAVLNKHNLKSMYNECTLPPSPTICDPPLPMTNNKIDFSEDVVNDIINTNDINLLENVCNPDFESASIGVHKTLKIVTPEIFLNFLQRDLDFALTEKTKWLIDMDSFDKFLDNMLLNYEDVDVNAMDCY